MKTAAYTAINILASTAHSLPQTLEQISQQLHDLQTTGQVVSTDGSHMTDSQLSGVHRALRRAGSTLPLGRSAGRAVGLEHTFRMIKQTLGWTRPKLRTPEAADRWTWLVIAHCHEVRGREMVSRCRAA